MENNQQIAGAIILAGFLIAGAVLLKGEGSPSVISNPTGKTEAIAIKPISKNEHIFGNKNAKIMIVEYSDTECPFCKIFHNTLHQIVAENNGEVAWVYRHYPIPQLHKKAFHEAEALECANELGGNDMFWKYTDELYKRTESNDRLDVEELPKIANDVGLNVENFNTCLASGKHREKIEADMREGALAGVDGTPGSFIVKNGKVVDTIRGALPIEAIRDKLDKVR